MTPLCHGCGDQLVRWRHLDRVDVGKGPVKNQQHMVCPGCRLVYRVTLTVWRDGLAEHQPTRHTWPAWDAAVPAVSTVKNAWPKHLVPWATKTCAAFAAVTLPNGAEVWREVPRG